MAHKLNEWMALCITLGVGLAVASAIAEVRALEPA